MNLFWRILFCLKNNYLFTKNPFYKSIKFLLFIGEDMYKNYYKKKKEKIIYKSKNIIIHH